MKALYQTLFRDNSISKYGIVSLSDTSKKICPGCFRGPGVLGESCRVLGANSGVLTLLVSKL